MKKRLLIQGMHCASCVGNIEKSLRKIKGVREINISLMTNKCIVEVADGVSDEILKKAVSRAGYKVVGIGED